MSDQKNTTGSTGIKTVLGADCRITGELALDNDAVIMGQFRGTLRISGVLEITDSAQVSGTIVAGAVRLAGRVEADVVAEHGVEILAGGNLRGQLYTTTISVVEGAIFEGEMCVGPKAMQAAAAILNQASEEAAPATPAPRVAAQPPLEIAQQHEEDELIDEAGEGLPQADWQPSDEAAEETGPVAQAPQQAPAAPVRTVSTSLNSILQRRRTKVLTGVGTIGAGLKPAGIAKAS